MENVIVYPAIFRWDGEWGGYLVEIPDINGFTEGKTLEEAFLMAGDYLHCYFYDEDIERPKPTSLSKIKVNDGEYAMLVRAVAYESEEAKKFKDEEKTEKL